VMICITQETTFNATISACEKCGQWLGAIRLLQQCQGPSVVTFNATISACENLGLR